MSDNLKVVKECGALIKYILSKDGFSVPVITMSGEAFDTYTSRILASQQAAHEAEIAKWIALSQANEQVVALAQKRADKAERACAMKDEALKAADEYLTPRVSNSGTVGRTMVLPKIKEALSASPQQVSEWEAKKLEPLQKQMAFMVSVLRSMAEASHGTNLRLEAIKLADEHQLAADEWEAVLENRLRNSLVEPLRAQVAMLGRIKELAAGLDAITPQGRAARDEITIMLRGDTQATAEQFIADCEQRGAVKALEDAIRKIEQRAGEDSFYSNHAPTFQDAMRDLKLITDELRATSKKAG